MSSRRARIGPADLVVRLSASRGTERGPRVRGVRGFLLSIRDEPQTPPTGLPYTLRYLDSGGAVWHRPAVQFPLPTGAYRKDNRCAIREREDPVDGAEI